jgi:multidrug transporter EmrE-like cation transporter
MKFLPFILFTVLTNAAAQLMLKQGMTTLPGMAWAGNNPLFKLIGIVFHPWVFAGLATFVISMASHMFVLSKVELSFAYPFLSLAYVAVAVASWYFFSETVDTPRMIGIALIMAGTVFIAQSGSSAHSAPSSHVQALNEPAE